MGSSVILICADICTTFSVVGLVFYFLNWFFAALGVFVAYGIPIPNSRQELRFPHTVEPGTMVDSPVHH